MAEVKNTFIQSKMNQDLDGRIIPNGQYRYGKNIQISRSEGDDVGALENVLGTELLTTFGLTDCGYDIIGYTVDVANDLVYVFITDYSDSSVNQLDNNITGQNNAFGFDNKNCFIGVYNDRTKAGTLLVGGDFLNFSKTHLITGVNLVEDLLFWTDNRNQPRKINVNTVAVGSENEFVLGGYAGYYTNEDTISVAKYYPFECISLLRNDGGAEQWVSTMTNKTEEWLPSYCVAAVATDIISTNSVVIDGVYNNIDVGVKLTGVNIAENSLSVVTAVTIDSPVVGETTIDFSGLPQSLSEGDLIYFSFLNPNYDINWPGDETYLSDKFVRFSYRFKFDDGEYSLMAPFTQECFVPKQDGYFIGGDVENLTPPMKTSDNVGGAGEIVWPVSDTLIGDEGKAYSSSIVEFFENKIQNIEFQIPAPYKDATQLKFDAITEQLKIISIDIIYKESESTVAYVLDTIDTDVFSSTTTSFYSYDYQSRKPWKTLPEKEITRVYDKVPIRALAQESSGNRIIYGNYIDKHTSPDHLGYVVGIDPKSDVPESGEINFGDKDYYIQKEYQNHTVKQNRTYQVGVVLSDRYGRQSDVILSDIYNAAIGGYGSTIYHPYRTTQSTLIDSTDTWPGDQINMIWHEVIPEAINKTGYPGIYKNNNGKLVGIANGTSSNWGVPGTACGKWTVDVLGSSGSTATITFYSSEITGDINEDTVVVLSSSDNWEEGETITLTVSLGPGCAPGGEISSDWVALTLVDQNTLGWYSWKIVVKQTENEYYNCYLPGMLSGYPKDIRKTDDGGGSILFPKGDNSKVAHIVLINDNINKIPRDLSEIGPQQKVFGSSVKLFGRVENFKYLNSGNYNTINRQFDPETLPDVAINIGNLTDLELGSKRKADIQNEKSAPLSYPESGSILIPINFFNGISNPIVAEISTKKEIGWSANDSGAQDVSLGMIPYLSVYETAPVTSDLDIYWETSTGGLISDLNYNIINVDNTVPCGITNPSIDWIESDAPGTVISDVFTAVSCSGVELSDPSNATTISLISVKNGLGSEKVNEFVMEEPTPGQHEYQISLTTAQYEGFFLAWNNNARRTWTFTFRLEKAEVLGVSPAFSKDIQITEVVQNAAPNQKSMYDLAGGNNARTDLKVAVYPEVGYFNTGQPFITPPSDIVGDWQLNVADYAGDPANHFWSTFGINYNAVNSFWPANTGSGANNDGTQAYFPAFNVVGKFYTSNYPAHTPRQYLSAYLDQKITMVNGPSAVVDAWIGEFKSFNGAYGTDPLDTPPTNPSKGVELVYSIARAYQVSAFFPYSTALIKYNAAWNQQYSIGEAVFAGGNVNNIPVINLLPQSFLGMTWEGWIGNQNVPTGPIYFDYADGNTLDPADYYSGGEATVGQRYNGNTHYWESLANNTASSPSMLDIQTPGPGVNEMPNSPSKNGFWYVNEVFMDGEVPYVAQSPGKVSLGLAQAEGINNGEVPSFRIKQSSPPIPYAPQEAYLYTDPFVPMPPGRYVVTVRVTDRSVSYLRSGDAMYFEWDIPVIINGPFVRNTGSFLITGSPIDKYLFDIGIVDTFPWKDQV